jgi:paraquat-inducible protein B
MASQVSRFKLGLFVVIGLVALFVTMIGIGVHLGRSRTVDYRSYFSESVQGLDVGAAVKFRGVTIGRVSTMRIAQDGKLVEVVEEISGPELQRLQLLEDRSGKMRPVPSDLRARIASAGITGVKFVAIDYLDPVSHPPPPLPFDPPPNYIPAAKSMLKGLEEAVLRASDQLPELTSSIGSTMARIDRMLAELDQDNVTETFSVALKHADQALAGASRTLERIDAAALPERSANTLDDMQRAIAKVNTVLDRVDGDAGLVASASRAAESIEDLGNGTRRTTRQLDASMRTIQEAADAIRLLAETLEREPDMLLKGRSKAKKAADR